MTDEETTWRWRWRCPECGEIIQGEGDRAAAYRAEVRIVTHSKDERSIREAATRLAS